MFLPLTVTTFPSTGNIRVKSVRANCMFCTVHRIMTFNGRTGKLLLINTAAIASVFMMDSSWMETDKKINNRSTCKRKK